MAEPIAIEVVGVSVAVLIYSVFCLSLCASLIGLLLSYGERWTYITIHCCFTALSTLASIIQQIHYVIAWRDIKQAQFDQAIRSQTEEGLSFGRPAVTADLALYYIQFWCYNTMALNTFFWSASLFMMSWGLRATWLGEMAPRIEPLSKVFAMLFPSLIIGLVNAPAVLQSAPATFWISNSTLFFSLSMGSVLMVLILYKYMKTRRLATGNFRKGRWWASDKSQSRNGGSTTGSTIGPSTRSSIYDRALITRFTIAFVLLVFFLGAIIVFSYVASTTTSAIIASGGPDLSVSGANIDVVLFIPGVTASLVNFLVFGTAKPWAQYRNLLVSGCGIRKKQSTSSVVRDRSDRQRPLEFERLPSLQNTYSAEERMRSEEAKNRVKMFSREIRRPSTVSTSSKSVAPQSNPTAPTSHRPTNSNTNNHFHTPFDSSGSQTEQQAFYSATGAIRVGLAIEPEDQVIQNGGPRSDDYAFPNQHFEEPQR